MRQSGLGLQEQGTAVKGRRMFQLATFDLEEERQAIRWFMSNRFYVQFGDTQPVIWGCRGMTSRGCSKHWGGILSPPYPQAGGLTSRRGVF